MNKIIKTRTPLECAGCQHEDRDLKCLVYAYPETKWSAGNCPMATHVVRKDPAAAKELDPIKASKRKMKGAK